METIKDDPITKFFEKLSVDLVTKSRDEGIIALTGMFKAFNVAWLTYFEPKWNLTADDVIKVTVQFSTLLDQFSNDLKTEINEVTKIFIQNLVDEITALNLRFILKQWEILISLNKITGS